MRIINKYRNTFYWTLLTLSTLVAFLRPIGFDPDSRGYYNWIELNLYNEMGEPFLVFLIKNGLIFFNSETTTRIIIIVYASLNLAIVHIVISKYSKNKLLSLFLYFSIFYPILTLTQIRFGVAASLAFWAFFDLSKNRLLFLFKILLGSFFHVSALLLLPLIFFYKKRASPIISIFFILIAFISSFFNRIFLPVFWYISGFLPDLMEKKVVSYLKRDISSMNLYNSTILFFVLLFFYAIGIKTQKKENILYDLQLNILTSAITIYFLCTFIPTLSSRFLYSLGLVSVILIPSIQNKKSQLFIIIILAYACLLPLNLILRHNFFNFGVFK